ncbi:MAG: sodium/proline symporter [Phycisphaerales bacterium]|nr:sodium/proline symporter [Phycisphaerales bacterium]MCB9837616.1 sodium/proline symporter [Phycisphaera sp.]
MRDIRDYFAGGKRLGFINVAFSARATGESAWLLIGLTAMGFTVGVQAFWVVVGEMLGVGGAWLLLAKRFKRLSDRYDSITVPDYLESRLRDSGHWLRLIAAGSLVIFVPIYAGSQVYATGKAFHSFLGWNHFLGATIGFLVVLFYITKGGFVAVVWSDVFQGTLMLIGLVMLPIAGLLEAGGVTNIIETLRANDPNHLSITAGNGWTLLTLTQVIGFAAIGIGFLGSPQVFVRFISLRSEKEIGKGAAVALAWTILADSGAVLVGIVGRSLFTLEEIGGDKDNILPFMSQTIFPAFLAGIYIAIVLSAIMSTIDSLLVVASSAAVRDYWQKTKRPDMPDDRLVKLSQRLTLILALVAFGLGMALIAHNREKEVFWLIIFGWSGIAATFCPVIILSLFWSKLTSLGAKVGMVTGFACVPFFKFAAPPLLTEIGWEGGVTYLGALDVLLPAFLVAGLASVAASLLDKNGRARLASVEDELRDAGTGN